MEKQRNRLAVVVAGYPGDMHRFIASNAGLKSRFTHHVMFADYTPAELVEIFRGECSDAGVQLDSEAVGALEEIMATAYHSRDPNFGNGRFARNLFDQAFLRLAKRVNNNSDAPTDILLAEDLTGLRPPPPAF